MKNLESKKLKKQDEDLKELEKRSEIELKKLEDRFDAVIKMKKKN